MGLLRAMELEAQYSTQGIRVPADHALDGFGGEDAGILPLVAEVRNARKELFEKRAAALLPLIESVVKDSPGESGAPV